MSLVSTEEALLAFLWTESVHDPDGGSTLSSAVETITSGDGQLSQQVEVGMAAETLSEQGLVHRETADDDRVRLTLTDEGSDRAGSVHDDLAQREIELVGKGETQTLTVEDAAEHLDQTVAGIGATASGDGVVYRHDQQPTDGLIDRATERTAWDEVVERCRTNASGEAVFLIGSNGIGKTTLAEEMIETADDDVDVARASCGRAATEPYEPIRELLASTGSETDPFAEAESSEGAAVTGAAEQASAYQAKQTAMFRDVTDLLAPTGETIRILFFDDLHRADAATVAYLKHLLDELPDHPIIVMATHVPGKVSDSSLSVDEIVGDATQVTRLELDGLDRMETKQLIEQVVGQRGAPDGFVEAIHERTGGTPLYVESTVEALLDSDQLDPRFRWYPDSPDAIELPDAVRQTVSRQIDGLDDTTRDILRWTATAGEGISVSLLQAVCDQPAQQVAATIDVLAEAAIFERHERQNTLSLRSNLTREALLEEMGDEERRTRHETLARKLADGLADQDDSDTSQHAASIAYHYEEADDAENAIEWYRDAADQATAVYAHETAIQHYTRTLDVARQADMTESMLSASEQLADIYSTVGEYDQAERHVKFIRERVAEDDIERRQRAARLSARIATVRGEYDRADEEVTRGLELDETPSEELCRLLGVAAEARRNRGRYDTARVSAERQRELATELDLPKLRAEALRHLGRIEYRQDHNETARQHFQECRTIADRLGDQAIESAAFHDLAMVAWTEGRLDDAEDNYQRAMDIREEIGDRHGRARSMHNLGIVAHNRGNYERARELYERSSDIEGELGDEHGEAQATHNLGMLEQAHGDYERARECYEESLSIERDLGDRQGVALGYESLGSVALEQGQYGEASERLEEALTICRDIDDTTTEALCLTNLGRVALERAEYDRAREYYEEGLDSVSGVDNPSSESNALSGLGWVAYNQGAYDEAVELFESALNVIRGKGDPTETADCLHGLAAVDREYGRYERAHERLDEAWELVEGGDVFTRAQLRFERARVELEAGEPAAAREEAEQAHELYTKIDATHWIGRCDQLLGTIATETDEFEAAEERFATARDAFESIGDSHGRAAIDKAVGTLERNRGNPEQARAHLESAFESLDSIGARADAIETLELLVSLALDHGWTDDARDWCETGLSLVESWDADLAATKRAWFEEQASQID